MKKTLLASSLVVMFLAACGGGNTATSSTQTASTSSEQSSAANNQTQEGQSNSNLAATDQLKIYNWSDYVDPDTVKEFEAANKVKVTYDYYDSNETLEAKVLTGRSGYDLVSPSNTYVPRQVKAGAYQKIDKSLISNYGNIDPSLLKLLNDVDPGNEYVVPYFWGINTLAINKDKVEKALGGVLPDNQWDLLFKPEYSNKLKSCGISILDSSADVFPMVLNYMGKDPHSEKTEDLQAAKDILMALRPDIRRFSSSGYIDDMARGDLCLVLGYGGDLNIAARRAIEAKNNVNIEVLVPKEGFGVWVDVWAIPKDAVNIANAHKYINYTLDPKIAARNGNYVTYAPASKPAKDLMEKEYASNRSIFPNEQDLQKGFMMVPVQPDTMKLMVRWWQDIKKGA